MAGPFLALGLRFSLPLLTISERKLGETSEQPPWHQVPAALCERPAGLKSVAHVRMLEAAGTGACHSDGVGALIILELHESWKRLLLVS